MGTFGEKIKTVFWGTPEFARPGLIALLDSPLYEVSCVVTQPDRPAGRGQDLSSPPVKKLALEYGVPCYQPQTLKGLGRDMDSGLLTVPTNITDTQALAMVEFLNAHHPFDVFVTAAYGLIIVPSLLDFARYGMVNIHPSLLPRWRGAAPLQWSIFSGDEETGVCLMRVEKGLDTGAVYCAVRTPIAPEDTFGSLHDRTAALGARLLLDNLQGICSGLILPREQDSLGAKYAEKWEKEDAQINWLESAAVCSRRIRASTPSPGARFSFQEQAIKVFECEVLPRYDYPSATPGRIVALERDRIVVSCSEGFLGLTEIQLPGRKRLPVREVLKGFKIQVGQEFN